MRKKYQVVRCFEDERTIIAEFVHSDISSNNFLRSWTQPCWHDYFEYVKELNMRAITAPEFSEKNPLSDIENFCSPLSVLLTNEWEDFMLRYFVIEARD